MSGDSCYMEIKKSSQEMSSRRVMELRETRGIWNMKLEDRHESDCGICNRFRDVVKFAERRWFCDGKPIKQREQQLNRAFFGSREY